MAALTAPRWEATTPGARDLLALLGRLTPLRPFYLAGGTALALRLGHRIRTFTIYTLSLLAFRWTNCSPTAAPSTRNRVALVCGC
jgi:hypothetical protein